LSDVPASTDAYDEALERLAGLAPEYGPGLSNHGPMVAEALVRLGCPDAVGPWVERYRRRLDPGPSSGRYLDPPEWQAALGDRRHWADWVTTFETKLGAEPAEAVVARWVPRLAPGTVGGAGHGLLRTAHAVRALAEADRPGRRAELAQGLAYWAASYQELPGPPLLLGPRTVPEALAAVPPLPEEAPEEPTISGQLTHLDMVAAPFEQAVSALAEPADLVEALDEVALGGAGAYLDNADGGDAIALIHTVTVPLGLELLLPLLADDEAVTAFAYGWQAAAGLHAAFAPRRAGQRSGEPPAPEQVVAAALASGDEHAIKLAEACLRVYARRPHPDLLAAPADAARRLTAG
jgi:hypothetical protein